MMQSILTSLSNNADVIALIIFAVEVTSLLFNANRSPGYVDDKNRYNVYTKICCSIITKY
jgi:hypothetical protein